MAPVAVNSPSWGTRLQHVSILLARVKCNDSCEGKRAHDLPITSRASLGARSVAKSATSLGRSWDASHCAGNMWEHMQVEADAASQAADASCAKRGTVSKLRAAQAVESVGWGVSPSFLQRAMSMFAAGARAPAYGITVLSSPARRPSWRSRWCCRRRRR